MSESNKACGCPSPDALACSGPSSGAMHVGVDPCPCACHGEPFPPVAALPPPSPLEAAALAFCAAIRPDAELPSVADLCEAAATFRAGRGAPS